MRLPNVNTNNPELDNVIRLIDERISLLEGYHGSLSTNIESANSLFKARTREQGTSVGIGGVAIAYNCGSWETTSSDWQIVDNQSLSIETSGKPIFSTITPQVGDAGSSIDVFDAAGLATTVGGKVGLFRNGVCIGSQSYFSQIAGGSFFSLRFPVSSFSVVDYPPAGEYSYTLRAYVPVGGGVSIGIYNAKLIIYEF